jgi:phage regulator Rha-like protein
MTTSLKVAKVFGKEHKHVLRDIEKLDCSADFRASNFGLTEIEVQAGAVKRKSPVYLVCSKEFKELNFEVSSCKPKVAKRSYPMYLMPRDGFAKPADVVRALDEDENRRSDYVA